MGKVVQAPDDELLFGGFLEETDEWLASMNEANTMFGYKPKLLGQAEDAVTWHHLKRMPWVQAAMALDPALTCRLKRGRDHDGILVRFTDRQAAMLFKLTWVG